LDHLVLNTFSLADEASPFDLDNFDVSALVHSALPFVILWHCAFSLVLSPSSGRAAKVRFLSFIQTIR